MATIPLHGKRGEGQVALCDDQDYALLSEHRWHLSKTGYPRTRAIGMASGTVDMHRLLTDERGGHYKDHISGDRLDNRRANLRACTQAENSRNRKMHSNNKTGFKGVSPWRGQYRAAIHLDGEQRFLGTFPHPALAAIAYNAAARALFGPFAQLNVIPPLDVRILEEAQRAAG